MQVNASRPFQIVCAYQPVGDQPAAIDKITTAIAAGQQHLCLLGATGTGKTFTMANVIERTQKPTLILSHNKTLAAQLFEEMRELFPHNAVNYFVSYYDYYQPEAYIPQRDIYIEKDASRNDDLDRLRLAATSNLMSRRDVIIVASVSCIYGLGSPEEYKKRVVTLRKNHPLERRGFLLGLAEMQYRRVSLDLERGTYRVRGDSVEIYPAYEEIAVRIESFGDEVERIEIIDPTTGEVSADLETYLIFPAVQYVMPEEQMHTAIAGIREELKLQSRVFEAQGQLLEMQRINARTRYDLEMIEEVGYCSGIENYSRHFDGRPAGSRPWTLLDYFSHIPGLAPDDWLLFVDESHVTLPQVRGMYFGDKARKTTLVNHGFRLPSALDNRPLTYREFEQMVPRVVYVSATPSAEELEKCAGQIIEQVIRPTGLLDPEITILPARGQVPDLIKRCKTLSDKGDRVLVTALTKRLCEDLTRYLDEQGLKVRYLHSEIETLDRLEILRALRAGEYDILVGVNLLREGLDLPEVALVCILDADKQGFLRSATSLIQQMGRAARNVDAQVVMYADKVTPAMQQAIDETNRRREIQLAHNSKHNITPTQIKKAIRAGLAKEIKAQHTVRAAVADNEAEYEREELVGILEHEMFEAAENLEFEKAARLRDQVKNLKTKPNLKKFRRSQIAGDSDNNENRTPGAPGTNRKGKRKGKPQGHP